jgi:hypothetical protein
MSTLMISEKEEGRLLYIDVIRWQDSRIHVFGRREESISSDGSSYRAFHIIHDASTGEVISEDFFIYRGNFPLFMCGCYILSCEGDCPPLLDHELALNIHENKIKADKYDNSIREFKVVNLNDLRKTTKI